RVVVPGDRVGQGDDDRSGDGDQEHPDRRGAEPPAGEDPLLGSGRGRDQERDRRLQGQAEQGKADCLRRPRGTNERIAVSDKAVAEIKKAAGQRATPPKGLRVGIRGGGCTGFSYLFEWSDADPRPEDKVLSYEDGRVRVFVDPKRFLYLDGSTLESATSMMGRGFKFVNPNVKGSCGCGESVQF